MSHEFTIELGYSVGQIEVRFDGESSPDSWNDMVTTARTDVQDELYEIADLHKWRDSFETAQEYSMPGMSPEPEVGTLLITDDGEMEVNLSIDSIHDCDWE